MAEWTADLPTSGELREEMRDLVKRLESENAALRRDYSDVVQRAAALEAHLAAVTPWEIVGRVPTEEERNEASRWLVVADDGVQLIRYAGHWCGIHGGYRIDLEYLESTNPRFMALGPDSRPMPKPAHIP